MSGLCIFPQDDTTVFLKPIGDKLQSLGFVVYDGNTNCEQYKNDLLSCISRYDYIVFLGHGSSDALSGSNLKPLINADNIGVLRGKRLFLLACNSKEFISDFNLKDSIGFDIIPTGDMDVSTILDQDYNYFENIPNNNDFEWFKSALVRIVVNSFDGMGMSSMNTLYNRIKMHTNLERYECIRTCKGLHYRDILKMLYDFKENMILE